jgi:hypothetical protein
LPFIGKDPEKEKRVCKELNELWGPPPEPKTSYESDKDKDWDPSQDRRIERKLAPPAPEGSPLGKYAFSPQRQQWNPPPPKERNTPIENSLLKRIANHFSNEKSQLTSDQIAMITGFIRDGLYSDFFVEPRSGTLYRGMVLTADQLVNAGIDPNTAEQKGEFRLSPNKGRLLSSWTNDLEVARAFSRADPEFMPGKPTTKKFSAVFSADASENPGKFIDMQAFYDTSASFPDLEIEDEIIGVGTIIANKVTVGSL